MPAGRTALFVALNPVATAVLLSIVVRGEHLSLSRWAGIAVALFGALVVISRGDLLRVLTDLGNTFGSGERFMLCAVLSWAAYTVIGRRALDGLSPLAATTYAALGPRAADRRAPVRLSAGNGTPLTWQAVTSMLYLGAIGTVVAFVWYSQGIREFGPARAAVFTNPFPVFGVLLSVALLGEPLSASMLAGGALVIAGVALTNRARR